MNRSLSLVAVIATVSASMFVSACSSNPKEVNYVLRGLHLQCDKIFECLTAQQVKELHFGTYIGSSAADCKAIYDVELADVAVRGGFANRTLDETQANLCVDALSKLSCDDVKKSLANSITPADYNGDSQLARNARGTLGFQDGFACTTDSGACLAEPACNLGVPAGPCAQHKVAPLKDPTLRQQESTDMSRAELANAGCGPQFSL